MKTYTKKQIEQFIEDDKLTPEQQQIMDQFNSLPTGHPGITADLKVMTGKPVVAGTRIPVEPVLAKLADNLDLEDLFDAYPRLTREDVKACLEYSTEVVKKHGRQLRQNLRIQAAADELESMILKRYPNTTFALAPDENSREAFLLNVTVDVEDTDEIMDLVVDRVVDFADEGVHIHVLPQRARAVHRPMESTAAAERVRKLAGVWSDLDWEETEKELDRIRHESKPTPPIDLDLEDERPNK